MTRTSTLILEDTRWTGPWPSLEQWVLSLYPPFGANPDDAAVVWPHKIVLIAGSRAGTRTTNNAVICQGIDERDVLKRLASSMRTYLSLVPPETSSIYLGLVAYRLKRDGDGVEQEVEWTEKERIVHPFVRRDATPAVVEMIEPEDDDNQLEEEEEEADFPDDDTGEEEQEEEVEEEDEDAAAAARYSPPKLPG